MKEAQERADELENAQQRRYEGLHQRRGTGKSGTEALHNAVQKLSEKLIDMALDQLWKSIFPESSKGNNIWNVAGSIFAPVPGKGTTGILGSVAAPSMPSLGSIFGGSTSTGRTASGIDRSAFAKELAANPALKRRCWPSLWAKTKTRPQILPSWNRMMNRASMMKTSLAQEAHALQAENGYYAGYDPEALNDPKLRAMAEANLDKTLKGSNVSNFATDNASGDFAQAHRNSGMFKEKQKYNGDTSSHPATPAHAAIASITLAKQAQEQVEAQKKLQEQMQADRHSNKSLETPIADVGTNAAQDCSRNFDCRTGISSKVHKLG